MDDLDALVNQVDAQTDRMIPPAMAGGIIARANAIIVALRGL